MKKFYTTLLTAILLASLTGCNTDKETPDSSSNSHISDSTVNSDNSGNSGNSDSSTAPESDPEPPKPAGEPTFLTAPDGTPIYTSEISEVYTGSEFQDTKKAITLAEAEQIARTGDRRSNFTVKCDGFAYGYIHERSLNRVDNPEMFKDKGDGEYFEYLGEEFDVNTYEGDYSTDYMRIKVGDKFGTLTVKNAYTEFKSQYHSWYEGENFSDVPGVYLEKNCIEFDGELEMTGYVVVTPEDTFYGEGGDMEFYPDGDSSVILPEFGGFLNKKTREVCHFERSYSYGVYGGSALWLGNMFKVGCDTSGLQPGDTFVKVKIVLDNIKYDAGMYGMTGELKSIEVI